MKRLTFKLFILFLVLLSFSCSEDTIDKDYIFLITLDTTRADSINYAEDNERTPNLEFLAKNGMYYKNAFSLSPITLPSHYSMFYSQPPWKTGVHNNGDKVNLLYPGLTELMKRKGYFTGAIISLGVLKSQFGLKKGFNIYEENFTDGLWYRTASEVNRDAFKMIEKVKRKKAFYWIHYSDPHFPYYPPKYSGKFKIGLNDKEVFVSDSIKSFTVKLNLIIKSGKNILKFDTKIPDNFPDRIKKNISGVGYRGFIVSPKPEDNNIKIVFEESWLKRKVKDRIDFVTSDLVSSIEIINKAEEPQKINIEFVYNMRLKNSIKKTAYLEEISYMDKNIGELISFLKEKGIYKNSTFVIMGDHGEGFGEYKGHIGHIHYLNKVFLNVPLILSGKRIKRGETENRLVSNLNIAPTILDIAGIKKPRYMFGKSLFKTNVKHGLLSETYKPQAYYNSFSYIDYPYQLIYFPEKTGSEKFEFYNLIEDKFGINNIIDGDIRIKNELMKKIMKTAKSCLKNKNKTKISKKDDEILRSLGYI